MSADKAPVAIIMGSRSDWPTMKAAADALKEFGVASEAKVVSAHLAGVTAAFTILPVIGVPILGESTEGLDSLLSAVLEKLKQFKVLLTEESRAKNQTLAK